MKLPIADLELIRTMTEGLWEEARGKRIFVTGGTGFFGCWIVESFSYINQYYNLNAQMVVLTRDPARFLNKCPHLRSDSALKLCRGDVRNFDFIEGTFELVIHAATEARASQATNAPLEMLSTIARGTERVLEFAANHGTRKFLLTSSGAVYGPQPKNVSHVAETYPGAPDPLDPSSVYAEGKRTAELLCALYGSKSSMECKIARCWAFCGPHLPLNEHFAIGNFIGDAIARRPIQIVGDGTPRRSYLYAADLAIWLWTILFRAPALVPFNVGSARDISILELAQTVAKVVAPNLEIRIGREPDPKAPPSRYVPAVDRARSELQLKELVDLEKNIQRTADWYIGNLNRRL